MHLSDCFLNNRCLNMIDSVQPPLLRQQALTRDLQLIHRDSPFPSVQSVVHAQGLDDMHRCLAHSGEGVRYDKGLQCAILPFHHMHPDSHPVGALLTPAVSTLLTCTVHEASSVMWRAIDT